MTTQPTHNGTTVTLSDADSARTVTVHIGDRLSVVLHSTYWTFAATSNPSVLLAEGQPAVSPNPSGCVPGQGCGTVTAGFVAIAAGSAEIGASRTSCGEALRCSGSAGSYRLTVIVKPN